MQEESECVCLVIIITIGTYLHCILYANDNTLCLTNKWFIFCASGFILNSNMRKMYTAAKQSLIFCQVSGARLNKHVIQSLSIQTKEQCIQSCLSNPYCVSLNYIRSNQTCQLNDAVWSDWLNQGLVTYTDFERNLDDNDFLHLTSQSTCQ